MLHCYSLLMFNKSKNVTDIVIQNENIDIGLIDSGTVGEKGECTLHLNHVSFALKMTVIPNRKND